MDLPPSLRLNEETVSVHQDLKQLGALFSLHLTYHQCYCDLLRVVLPGYVFPITAGFANAPPDYIAWCRRTCWEHACVVSQLLETALQYGLEALADEVFRVFAYESTRIQVTYTHLLSSTEQLEVQAVTARNAHINMSAIEAVDVGLPAQVDTMVSSM
jgi:hypothetical protein